MIDFQYFSGGKRTLFFAGTPCYVPLPPMLFISSKLSTLTHCRFYNFGYWVKEKPVTLDEIAFDIPLPNVHPSGYLCDGQKNLVFGAKNAMNAFFTASFNNLSHEDYGRGRHMYELLGLNPQEFAFVDHEVLEKWASLSVQEFCKLVFAREGHSIYSQCTTVSWIGREALDYFRVNPIIYSTSGHNIYSSGQPSVVETAR